MGKIEVKRRAPKVFTNERSLTTSFVGDGESVKKSLKQLGNYPDFGVCVHNNGQYWYEPQDTGPFNPNENDCGEHDFDNGTIDPELYFSDDFLICGMGPANDDFVEVCDFDHGFDKSFSICGGNEICKPKE